jgi:hypothetical protein
MPRRSTATDQNRCAGADVTWTPAGGWPALAGAGQRLGERQAGVELEFDLVGHLQGSEQS